MTYVPKNNHVDGPSSQVLDDGMRDDLLRQIHIELEEGERRFGADVLPPHLEVAVDIPQALHITVCGLLHDGLAVRVERADEMALGGLASGHHSTLPEPGDRGGMP